MMRFYLILISIFIFTTNAYADRTPAKITQQLRSDFQSACKQEKFSGAVLVAIDNQIIFEQACGLASRSFNVPNNLETKFNLASVGKLFTSVAIAQLIQQNKISLSTPVYKILPSWLPEKGSEKMTIGHLLTHMSGLGSFMDDERWKRGSDSALYVEVNDYKPLIHDEKIKYTPGTSQFYSNSSYLLLGAIVEAVTKMKYTDYIAQHIFIPAGMKNTGLFRLDEITPNLAQGYFSDCKNKKCIWRNNNYEAPFVGSPAGGAYSSLEDLFHFSRALHQNHLLNSAFTHALLSTEIVAPAQGIYVKKLKVDNIEIPENFSPYGPVGAWNQYGLAVWDTPWLVGHTGGIAGASSFFVTSPDGKYTIIYLSNMGGSSAISFYKKIRAALGFSTELSNF